MMLPNTFILGAAKSGTTSLSYWISQHTEIFLPVEKEIHYFDIEKRYVLGNAFYSSFYVSRSEKVRVDASPSYFHMPGLVIPKMMETYSDKELCELKFIIVLRNPIDRAFSHYLHRKRLMKEERSFEEAIDDSYVYSEWKNYVKDGFYSEYLSEWYAWFRKDQFLIFTLEDLIGDENIVLNKVYEFLGVEVEVIDDFGVKNHSSIPRNSFLMRLIVKPSFFKSILKKMISEKYRKTIVEKLIVMNLKPSSAEYISEHLRKKLSEIYAHDIDVLGTMLNRDLNSWKAH